MSAGLDYPRRSGDVRRYITAEETVDMLQSWRDRYEAFCHALAYCPHVYAVIWHTGGLIYASRYLLMMPGCPIIVASGSNAGDPSGTSIYYNSRDWDAAEEVVVPYDGSQIHSSLGEWLRSRYAQQGSRIDKKWYSASDGAWVPYLSLMEGLGTPFTTISQLQMFKNWGSLFDLESSEKSKRWRAAAGTSEPGAWSEAMWPEAPGYRTEYIDNVGVFVPDWVKIDFNLSHSLGDRLVGVQMVRAPTTEIEAKFMQWGEFRAFMSFITGGAGKAGSYADSGEKNDPGAGGGAGIAQGIMNTLGYVGGIFQRQIQNARIVFPRIRAFGREQYALMEYQQYRDDFAARIGAPDMSFTLDGRTHNYVRFQEKNVIMLEEKQYKSFIDPLRSYVTRLQTRQLPEARQ